MVTIIINKLIIKLHATINLQRETPSLSSTNSRRKIVKGYTNYSISIVYFKEII